MQNLPNDRLHGQSSGSRISPSQSSLFTRSIKEIHMDVKRLTRFPIKKGEVNQLADHKEYAINADSGHIWFTQSNLTQDIFIAPGDINIAREKGDHIADPLSHSLVSRSFSAAPSYKPTVDTRALDLVAQGA
jgi:hypothetical protein